jgi:RNA polymerase-binding transcription factor DksA
MPAIDPLLELRLHLRAQDLRNQIATVRARSSESAPAEVGDAKDAAGATAQATIADAEVERDLAELREIGLVLGAIADKSYGICTECGSPIDPRRLVAQPTALRCRECQVVAEGGRTAGVRARPGGSTEGL